MQFRIIRTSLVAVLTLAVFTPASADDHRRPRAAHSAIRTHAPKKIKANRGRHKRIERIRRDRIEDIIHARRQACNERVRRDRRDARGWLITASWDRDRDITLEDILRGREDCDYGRARDWPPTVRRDRRDWPDRDGRRTMEDVLRERIARQRGEEVWEARRDRMERQRAAEIWRARRDRIERQRAAEIWRARRERDDRHVVWQDRRWPEPERRRHDLVPRDAGRTAAQRALDILRSSP